MEEILFQRKRKWQKVCCYVIQNPYFIPGVNLNLNVFIAVLGDRQVNHVVLEVML